MLSLPLRTLFAGLLLAVFAMPVPAQTVNVPRNDEAESVFTQAVQAFDEGDYGMAYRRFRLVYTQYSFNRKTTAALFMAAKARYRQGEREQAAALLRELVDAYGTSRYVPEAERMLRLLEGDTSRPVERAVLTLGIALPLGEENAPLTQALFNGIRLGVDEYNEAGGGPFVRMVFRDTRNEPVGARNAVADLREADVILGPLYSDEARSAAEAAERAGVTLVAPLATDEQVSAGKRHVFQANPTIEQRGRLMARYAMGDLRLNTFGIVVEEENTGLSQRMGEAFEDELRREGADVRFFTILPNARGWAQLATTLDSTDLAAIDGLYLPVSGGNADRDIRAALNSLGRTSGDFVILGDAEWHNRSASQASRYNTTYTNDFFVEDTPAARRFRESYQALSGQDLAAADFIRQRLAYTGYDLARYLIETVSERGRRTTTEALRNAPPYQGLGIRLDFRDGNVNEAMYVHRYRGGRAELVR